MTDENRHIIRLIDRCAASMERTSAMMREISVELRAFKRDIEDLKLRVGKLEGKRRG